MDASRTSPTSHACLDQSPSRHIGPVRYSACARELTSLQAPEIQTMYNIPLPISALRTRVRQEFEQNRFVAKLPVVDVLLFKSHAEYQVRTKWHRNRGGNPGSRWDGR